MDEDWVEFVNVGTTAINIGGWSFRDSSDSSNDGRPYVFPANTMVQPGAVIVVDGPGTTTPQFAFGLGDPDSIRLYNAAGTLVDTFPWTDPANTMGRCPDGTGQISDQGASKGLTNDCDDTADGGTTAATGRRRTR